MGQTSQYWRWVWLSVGMAALGLPTMARAEDAVDILKRTFKEENVTPAQIARAAHRLKTVSEMRRGYFLAEWPARYLKEWAKGAPKDPDQDPRAALNDRLEQAVGKGAQAADIDLQIAACILIAEIADSDQPEVRNLAGKYASRFTPLLIAKKNGLVYHDDVRVRQAALHALGKITPPPGEAMPVLKAVLRSGELGPRRLAAYALTDLVRNAPFLPRQAEMATINEAVAEAAALLSLAGQDEPIRGYCLQTILTSAKIFTDYRWTTKFDPLEDPVQIEEGKLDPSVQRLLKSYRDAMPSFLNALEHDPNANIKLTALETLTQIIASRYKICEKLQAKGGAKDLSRPELLKTYAAPDPIAALLDGQWIVIPRVLKSQEDIRLKRGVMTLLERVAEDIDATITAKKQAKQVTAEMLKDFAQAITPALADPDRYVRWTAARTLRYLSPEYLDEAVMLALGHMLIDPAERDPDLTAAAATTIDVIAASPYADRAVRFLRSAIADTTMDARNRVAAMKALVAIGRTGVGEHASSAASAANQAFPEVTSAVGDAERAVRREACLTLGQLGQPAQSDLYRAAIAALKGALRDADAEVRLNASEAILSITPP